MRIEDVERMMAKCEVVFDVSEDKNVKGVILHGVSGKLCFDAAGANQLSFEEAEMLVKGNMMVVNGDDTCKVIAFKVAANAISVTVMGTGGATAAFVSLAKA